MPFNVCPAGNQAVRTGERYRLAEGPASHRGRHRDRVACRGGADAGAEGDIGLTGGLSWALASDRLLVHDRGRMTADLGCAIAGGAEVISHFRVTGDQEDLSGAVAPVPAAWMRRWHESLRLNLDPLPDQGGPVAFTRDVKASELGRREFLVLM